MKIYFEKPKTLNEVIEYLPKYHATYVGPIILLRSKGKSKLIISLRRKNILTLEEEERIAEMRKWLEKNR